MATRDRGEIVSGSTLIVKVFVHVNTLTDRSNCIHIWLLSLETNLMLKTGEMQDTIRLANADFTFLQL